MDYCLQPHGNYLATAGADNIARVWNVNTGREIARIRHDDILWAVALALMEGTWQQQVGLELLMYGRLPVNKKLHE
jgi:WD40 repeat protein